MTFPARNPSNPLPGFNFAVAFAATAEVSGAIAAGGVTQTIAGFQEVTGLGASIEIHEYKEGGRNDFTHKFATSVNFENITFKRGVALTPDLWDWFNQARKGSFGARRSILIAHLGYDREVAQVWYVSRALPAKYSGPGWNSGQSSVAVESIEVAHEGLELRLGDDFVSAGGG